MLSCNLLHGKVDINTTDTTKNISANTEVNAQMQNMNETTNTTEDVEAVTQTVAENDNEKVNHCICIQLTYFENILHFLQKITFTPHI